jgi:hypothetical protein
MSFHPDILWLIARHADQSAMICMAMTCRALYERYRRDVLSLECKSGHTTSQRVKIIAFTYHGARVMASHVRLARGPRMCSDGATRVITFVDDRLHIHVEYGAKTIEHIAREFVITDKGVPVAWVAKTRKGKRVVQSDRAHRNMINYALGAIESVVRTDSYNYKRSHAECRIMWMTNLLLGDEPLTDIARESTPFAELCGPSRAYYVSL